MKKKFNITGCCYPDRHYMVDVRSKLEEIKELVDDGEYFVINRARQYGKTTTLKLLREYLEKEYIVILMDFQSFSTASFREEITFCKAFAEELLGMVRSGKRKINGLAQAELLAIERALGQNMSLSKLFILLSALCETAEKPVVLMIDEVDSASNNQVFLDFLSQLRNGYLYREENFSFQSVILAGVYDIKNLKHKIRPEEQHKYNSPWNIATDFKVDMSFSVKDIAGMLAQYEQDHYIGADVNSIAEIIYDYTSGYPYLVSYVCKLMDEDICKGTSWTQEGLLEAIKIIIKGPNTLYDDMIKHVLEYPELYTMLNNILFKGESYPYQVYDKSVDIGRMFGFIVEKNGAVGIANRIFETQLYNYFIMVELQKNDKQREALPDKNQFIEDGQLNMDKVMEKFYEYYMSLISEEDVGFIESHGRKIFLMFLRPIINGTGNYYVEDQSRNKYRTDIVVDYRGKQYIIELKIWHGEEYQNKGRLQLVDYMEAYHQNRGYLLSFAFGKNKETGIKQVQMGDKTILEVVV